MRRNRTRQGRILKSDLASLPRQPVVSHHSTVCWLAHFKKPFHLSFLPPNCLSSLNCFSAATFPKPVQPLFPATQLSLITQLFFCSYLSNSNLTPLSCHPIVSYHSTIFLQLPSQKQFNLSSLPPNCFSSLNCLSAVKQLSLILQLFVGSLPTVPHHSTVC